nr:Chain B, peptide THR-PRO-VAL-CYS-THR-THR-GLU-VAL [Saccharomyces cerevisiae S288C]
TPVCTTEV